MGLWRKGGLEAGGIGQLVRRKIKWGRSIEGVVGDIVYKRAAVFDGYGLSVCCASLVESG